MRTILTSRSSLPLIAAFAAVYLIWGSTYLAIAFAIETMPPFLTLSLRFGVAGVVLYAWMRLRGQARPEKAALLNAAVVGALTAGVGTGTVAWAEQHLATGVVALIVTLVPIWMVLLDWKWLGGGAPSVHVVAGLVLGFLGIAMLVGPDVMSGGYSTDLTAAFIVIGGSISWSVGSLHGKRVRMPANPFMSAAVQMIGGALILLAAGMIGGEPAGFDAGAVSFRSFAGWAYLVVFGSIVAFSAYVWLLGHTSPKKVVSYAYVNPVVAVFLGWLLAGEVVDGRILGAVAVLVTAVVLVVRYGQSDHPQHEQAEPESAVGRGIPAPSQRDGSPDVGRSLRRYRERAA